MIAAYRRLLLNAPDNLPATIGLARALATAGNQAQSVDVFQAAVEAHPASPELRIEFGNLLVMLGRETEAIEHYRIAVAIGPAPLDWRCNLSALLADVGLHKDAIDEANHALELDFNCTPALFNVATSLLALGDATAAIAAFKRCARLTPSDPRLCNNLGLALAAAGREIEALAAYEQALRLQPDYARALNNRASANMGLGRFEQAVVDLDRALMLEPRYSRAQLNRGKALRALGRFEESLASYRLAFPNFDALAGARDLLFHDLLRKEEAFVCAKELFRIAPEHDEVAGAYHAVAQATAHWEDYDKRIAFIRSSMRAGRRSARPFTYLYIDDAPARQLACAQAASAGFATRPALWLGERYGHQRIKVGYLSSDFRAHATAYLMAGLFERHDRTRFECFAFAHGKYAPDDPIKKRLTGAFEHFEDVSGLADVELATKIRSLEIDLLIDLKGYTAESRLAVLSYRPAPVQMHFLGYPGTLGANFIDYLIADHYVVPENQSAHFTERIVRMPHTYHVTDDRRDAPVAWSRSRAGLPASGLVFAALHQAYKLTPAVFAVWMRLLKRCVNSTLWLLDHGPAVNDRLCEAAARDGVHTRRLTFAPQLSQAEHLARLGAADIFFDTYPYGAHTTASDALWMGVPCVAVSGQSFAARVSGSILNAARLPHLITDSLPAYEARLVELCDDPLALQAIRRTLETGVRDSPLFDTGQFTRALESAYVTVWDRHEAGLWPAHIKVAETNGRRGD